MLSYYTPIIADLTYHERGRQWQFGSGQAERFARQRFINAIHFVQDFAWLNFSDVVLRITFTVTHTDFGLFEIGLSGKTRIQIRPPRLM
jgi:hypothetical protein